MDVAADGNRNKLFAGLTKKLSSLEGAVSEKDAQLRSYQSRDATLSVELHNTTVALGQERGLLNLANATVAKLEAKLQEIIPQFEYLQRQCADQQHLYLEQKRQFASLEEQLSCSNESVEELRSQCAKLAVFKEDQSNLDSSRSLSDREMLGSLIREVQSERTRAEQTRSRILEHVITTVREKKHQVHLLESFKRWKDEIRFYRRYNAVYAKGAKSQGTHLLRTALRSWRLIWPIGKYLSSSSAVRRMNSLLHSECLHRQERKCLTLRLLRNIGIARMAFKIWNDVVAQQLTIKIQGSSGSSSSNKASIRSGAGTKKLNPMDLPKYGIFTLNMRVKHDLRRMLLIWHFEASKRSVQRRAADFQTEAERKAADFQGEAEQARTQLAQELHLLATQRQAYEGEIVKIQSRSQSLAQKTVETLFGTNTKLIIRIAFNRLKNCALEGRARKIVELQESVLNIGENTAFKLLQYETAITMATSYCIRRLLPSVAFLTWKIATEKSSNQKHKQFERQQLLLHDDPQQQHELSLPRSTKNPGSRDLGTANIAASTNSETRPVTILAQASDSQTVGRDSVGSIGRDNTSPNSPVRPDGQHQTLSQLASFLMPAALGQALTRSPFLELHQANAKLPLGEVISHNSSLLDLQEKLSRLETRWASIRLNPS